MPIAMTLLILVVIGVPLGWILAEIHGKLAVRITLGLMMLLCSYGVAAIVGMIVELDYNAWYGGATKTLIDATVRQLEDGKLDRVTVVLRSLNRQFHPTYENRANYQQLVEDATARMRGDVEVVKGSAWDAGPFEQSTWLGHWEDDRGYWLVINHLGPFSDITRSGYPELKMDAVTVSEDCRVVTFNEGTQWRHTLKLLSKYEAEHVWFDLEKQSVWQTEHLYKLVRPTVDSKKTTQQSASTENETAK